MSLLVQGLCRVVEGTPILDDVSFELPLGGSCLFIAGPSGCGKTLLQRACACLDKLQGGTIKLAGRSPDEMGCE